MGYKIKDFLLIIPARCGSKGIKFKNIVDLNGYPLIYYTLEIAKKLKKNGIIDKIHVSTDCQKIKKVCESFGIKVGELRPKNLANDKSKTIDVIHSIIGQYVENNFIYKNILLLQPTSPLKTFDQVYNSIKQFKEQKANSLISVYKDATLSDDILYYKSGNRLTPKKKNHNEGNRRQDKPEYYIRNGAIYIVNTDFFMENRSLICSQPICFEMDKITSINIDESIDLDIVKKLI